LAEEYDVERGRQVGNFPHAFSHLGLIEAAQYITDAARGFGVRPVATGAAASSSHG
jgi:GH15 family glucan-1,4-alpha-glucosidase